MSKITYSIETLYHFNCHNCGGWWSVGDAPTLPFWFCPHCGFTTIAKPVEVTEPKRGAESTLLSIAGGLAARAIEEALTRDLAIEIPSLGIRIHRDGIRQRSSRGDSFLVKPDAT